MYSLQSLRGAWLNSQGLDDDGNNPNDITADDVLDLSNAIDAKRKARARRDGNKSR